MIQSMNLRAVYTATLCTWGKVCAQLPSSSSLGRLFCRVNGSELTRFIEIYPPEHDCQLTDARSHCLRQVLGVGVRCEHFKSNCLKTGCDQHL